MADGGVKRWPRGPHTEGKHLVLRNYLDGWLPILGSRSSRILIVDGFAGPGEYQDGEDGSPIIALKALIEHAHRTVVKAQVSFLFIEEDRASADHLRARVDALRPNLPPNTLVQVSPDRFEVSMTSVLDALDAQRERMAPAFVMVDPFGVSGAPMNVMKRILENPRSELYITFMYESINRFMKTDEFAPRLDALFGATEWREALRLSGMERRQFLYQLYARRLKECGAKQVVHFDLYRDGRLIYAIFFATQHLKGCDLMKKAIWKVAPSGDRAFRGVKSGQLALDLGESPDCRPLIDSLSDRFRGGEWVGIEEVEAYVSSDQVEYHTGHLKKLALRTMESEGLVIVDQSTRKKRGSYPARCRLRFL